MFQLAAVVATGAVVAAGASCGSSHPLGVDVDDIEDACRALTPQEVGAVLGVSGMVLMRDEVWDDVLIDTDTGAEQTSGNGRTCVYIDTPDLEVESILATFIVQLDPDRQFYDWEYEWVGTPADSDVPGLSPPDSVPDLGDEAFYSTNPADHQFIGYTARWGVWTLKVRVGSLSDEPHGVDPAKVADILRTFISRLPRDNEW